MYLMTKTPPGGYLEYLDSSEDNHKSGLKKGCNLKDLEKFYRENGINPKTAKREDYEKYLNQTNTHEDAKVTGGLAKDLNLKYSREVFSQALSGQVNGKNVTRIQENRQTGYSIVLTVPKSLSMLYALSSLEQQKKIREAINNADAQASSEIEKSLRPSKSGPAYDNFDPSKTKMMMFDFWHYEARAIEDGSLQPHLHKHKELMNFAEFEINGKKKMMALDAKTLFARQKELTATFNSLLVGELEKIGIKTEDQTEKGLEHSFRVVGISREKELEMSVRKSEIDKFVKEKKAKGEFFSSDKQIEAEYKEEVRRTSKQDKEEHNADKIHDLIRASTEKVIDKKQIDIAQQQEQKRIPVDLKSIIEGKLSLQGYLSETELKTALINEVKFSRTFTGLGDLQNEVDRQIARLEKEYGLVKMENGKFTTKSIISDEFDTQKGAKLLIKDSEPRSAKVAAQDAFTFSQKLAKTGIEMNSGQLEACKLVAQEHRLSYVIGDAGTGKTTTVVKFANEHYTSKGRKVIGLATQTLTANNLKDGDVKLKFSFADFFNKISKDGRIDRTKLDALKKTVFIVDEASMVQASDYRKLTALALMTDSTILLVGDQKQLQSVGAGNGLGIIHDELGEKLTTRLEENTRQKTQQAKTIAEGFRDKEPEKALAEMKKQGWLAVSNPGQSEAELMDKLAADFVADEKQSKLVIAQTNIQTDDLNDRIRARLVNTGELKKEDLDRQVRITITRDSDNTRYKETKGRYFAIGDKIIFNQNIKLDKKTKLQNGQNAVIKGIQQKKAGTFLTVEIDGVLYTFNADKHNTFTHAYAITAHKSQGQTVDNAYILGTENTSSNASYVVFSRHRLQAKLYIESSKLEGFTESSKIAQEKATTLNDKVAKQEYEKIERQRLAAVQATQDKLDAEEAKLREKKKREKKEAEEAAEREKERQARLLEAAKTGKPPSPFTLKMSPPKPKPPPGMEGSNSSSSGKSGSSAGSSKGGASQGASIR